MMRRGRRTSYLIALCLLAFPSSVSAECAWVLWATPPDLTWYVAVGGYQTRDSCELRATEMNKQSYKEQQKQNPAPTHLCLPDTIDPRGPKR